jgi:hypothetical protein
MDEMPMCARSTFDTACKNVTRAATLAERERVLGDTEGVVAFCNALHSDPLHEKTRLRIRAFAESLRRQQAGEQK